MRIKKTAWWSLLIVAMAVPMATSPSYAADEDGVREAVAQFYSALNVLFTGDVGPMKDVWSHADDVTYMGPDGGFQVGWEQVRENWEKQAAKKLGGEVGPDKMHVTVGQDIAVTHNYEKGKNVNVGGGAPNVLIRATNIFRKENGTWKMIGHHTDLLPFLSE